MSYHRLWDMRLRLAAGERVPFHEALTQDSGLNGHSRTDDLRML
jgi:hypothetical protein